MSRKVMIGLILGSTLVLLVLSMSVFFISLFSDERMVKKEISSMVAKGQPISIKELKSNKIPDKQNAAIIYEKIFSKMGSNVNNDSRIFEDFISFKKRQKDSSLWSKADQAAARYKNIIPMIEEATSKPDCSFLYTWTDDPFQEIKYSKSIRFLHRMLSTVAILDLKRGRIDDALHNTGLAFKVSESMSQEPSVIEQLERLSMNAISTSILSQIVKNKDINETDLRHLYDILSKIDLKLGLRIAIEGETAVGVTAYDNINIIWTSKPAHGVNAFIILPERRKIYKDELYFLRYMNICRDESLLPYRELKGKNVKMPTAPKHKFMSDTLIPVFGEIWWKRDHGIADISGSRILMALKAYRFRYGAYPSSLNELRGTLGWTIPDDPFSGKDFVYNTKGKGFVLYSLGPNLKDDGGVPYSRKLNPNGTASHSSLAYDIIWDMAN
ncbi:MAG: hypothetical protein ACYC27_06590 [Armatimonadota bacterium]